MELSDSFFRHDDVVAIARQLIGCSLHSISDGIHCAGIITETEAYAGVNDRASHAYGGRKTERTAIMFLPGGHVYVYFCYGMHHLFNIVTAKEGIPHAVLIRSLFPLRGADAMRLRRGKNLPDSKLCVGPGNLTKAMGISLKQNGIKMSVGTIWVEKQLDIPETMVISGQRIGVSYAGEDALLPYRFSIPHAEVKQAIV